MIRELRLSNADSVLLMPSHVRVLSDVVVGSQHVGRLRASELCDVEVHTALCPSVCLSVCLSVTLWTDSVLLMPSHVIVLSDVVVGSQHVELRDVELQTAPCPSVCLSHCG